MRACQFVFIEILNLANKNKPLIRELIEFIKLKHSIDAFGFVENPENTNYVLGFNLTMQRRNDIKVLSHRN